MFNNWVSFLSWTNLPNKKRCTLLILATVFLISIVFRLPHIDRPLSGKQEWLTSTVLRHMQIWNESSIRNYYFSPIMTYNRQADRNIGNQGTAKDSQGTYYYMSYPPFAYIFPYLIFEGLHIQPAAFPIQVFNILLHLFSCILIYLIVIILTREHYKDRMNIPAIVGFTVYALSPEVMWFQSNVYMADMMVQALFIGAIYLLMRILTSTKPTVWLFLIFGVLNFFMVYTEWLGVFFDATVVLYVLFKKRDKIGLALVIITIVSMVAPILLTIWQYAQAVGLANLIDTTVKKYIGRSGLQANYDGNNHLLNPHSWRTIFNYYWKGYFVFFFAIPGLMYYLKKKLKTRYASGQQWLALYLCGAPVIAHHLVLFNFTAQHNFSVLKTGVFIAVLLACLYDQLVQRLATKPLAKVNLILIAMIVISMFRYVAFVANSESTEYRDIGLRIQQTAKDDEVVFIEKPGTVYDVLPQVIVYAHRNVSAWYGEQQAKQLIRQNGVSKGIVYVLNDKNQIANVRNIQIDN